MHSWLFIERAKSLGRLLRVQNKQFGLTTLCQMMEQNFFTLTSPTDVSHYGWVASAGWAGINIDDFPALKTWEERMTARPGVEKGRHVPDPHTIKELLKDKSKVEAHAAKAREWVQAGMREDAAKHTETK